MRLRTKNIFRLAGAIAVATIASTEAALAEDTMQCAPLSTADVHELYDRWAEALKTLHPDKVLRTYAKDSTFGGIGPGAVREGFLEIRDYYVHFLQREPLAVSLSRTVRVGCNSATDVGVQELQLRPKAKQKYETLASRYTLNYEFRDGNWLIVNHHMSHMPEGIPAAMAQAPVSRVTAVAGFIKRLPEAKKAASSSTTETLTNGWTYTPGTWIDGAPHFPQP
jgi:uncharacterized protein (TIGR02246 family)